MLKNLQNRIKEKMKNQEGFTLIELIVVIAILGILAMLIMPNIMGFTKDANKAVAGQQFKVLDQAYMAQKALGNTVTLGNTLDTTWTTTMTASDATKVKAVTDQLGLSVSAIRVKLITANADKTSLATAVIQVKGINYLCTAQDDGTVKVDNTAL